MSEIQIVPLEVDGEIIFVEVTPVEVPDGLQHPQHGIQDLRESAKPVNALSENVKEKIGGLKELVACLMQNIQGGFKEHSPDEWSMEVAVGFAGEKGIPYLAKGSINADIKINVKWRKDPSFNVVIEENKS